MRRGILIAAGLLPLAVAGAAALWWYQAMDFGDHQIDRAIADAERDGWEISIGSRERHGFPLSTEWGLQGLELERALPAGTVKGRIPELNVSAKLWTPQHVEFAMPTPQEWQWQERGGDEQSRITVNHVTGSVRPRTDDPGWQAEAKLSDIAWTAPEGAGHGETAMALLRVPPLIDRADLDVHVEQITLPAALPFGKTVQSVKFSASLAPLPRALDQPTLAAWQAADGKVVLREAAIAFGALQTTLNGVLGLDRELRPHGRLAANITDPEALLRVASKEGWIGRKQLDVARFALGALARRRSDGQTELATDWRLRDGYLWLGPFQLAALPSLTLPSD